uniref:Uncharacterized protein n=1 Tax=Brassica oleracea var. oleracea TaxID=109376 RepID=A0A0D3E6Z7_BRAOL
MFVPQVEEALPGISATDVDTRKDKYFVKWLKSQMAPRTKPAAPTYAQLFGDGSGTSSSGPSSSDAVPDSQNSQRVFSSLPLPPQMQKWHWYLGITERVKAEFVAKAKISLCNTVFDWKDMWEIYGYEGKPTELMKDVWDGLIAYWEHPSYIKKANSCSASRRTKDKDGHLSMLHRTGQKPHAEIRLEDMTHATSDRVFVDPAFEKLFQAVATRIEERETQLTYESPDGLPVVPKKKGRIVGIGSVNEVARETSLYTSRRDEETAQMKARMDSQQVRLDSLEDLLDVMAVENPVMQRMLSERRAALGLPVRDPHESDPTRQQPSNPADYFEDIYVEFTTKTYVWFTTKPCSALYEEFISS